MRARLAAEMAKGASPLAAARAAKAYVGEALARSARLQIGSGSQRPFNHGCAARPDSVRVHACSRGSASCHVQTPLHAKLLVLERASLRLSALSGRVPVVSE